jgi:hypothetical protein
VNNDLHAQLKFILLLPVFLSSSLWAASNTAYINEIPDLTQSEIRGWQHGRGAQYCAPVAVSNSFYWLSAMRGDQKSLVKALASAKYMNTDNARGTTTAQLLHGVDAMAIDLFGGYQKLEYQGWKWHPRRFASGQKVPELGWIIDGVGEHSTVWLNVGWYQFDPVVNVYYRVGGHWVTLVGYEDDVLILHDPAPRAGRSFANEYVHVTRLRSGNLADPRSGMFEPAAGYLVLGTGMHLKPIADVAVIDGAVRFKK